MDQPRVEKRKIEVLTMSAPKSVHAPTNEYSTRLKDWIARHEVSLYFLATFVFSWAIYGCLSLISIENQTVLSRWLLIAAFGPSVTAMLISGIANPATSKPKGLPYVICFALAFVAVGAVEWLDHKWWNHRVDAALIVADLILVSLAALVISGVRFPAQGVRDLLSGLTRWRLGAGWYMLALVLWPAVVLGGNALASSLGLGVPAKPSVPSIPVVPLAIESFFWYLFFGGPLNEEAGWRGFAQTKLQRRFSPLTAGVIIGALWGLWHVPLHLMGVYPMGARGAIIRIFSIPSGVAFAWLFNRTHQSLLPVLVLHAARNTTSLFVSRNYVTTELLYLLLTVCVVFLDKMWRPLKPQPSQADSGS
jgi:membrane protease YdiL (CAAX protease family)